MVTTTVRAPSANGMAAAAAANTAINTISTMGRFQRSAAATSRLVLVCASTPVHLADDVEPDPAVLGPARLIALHTDLGPQLAGDVHHSGGCPEPRRSPT